jgi:hypothetical protein
MRRQVVESVGDVDIDDTDEPADEGEDYYDGTVGMENASLYGSGTGARSKSAELYRSLRNRYAQIDIWVVCCGSREYYCAL